MKLKYKFFIAFIITSCLILCLVVGVTQINIHKNFTKFLNDTEFGELTKMTGILKDSYIKYDGWAAFRGDKDAWNALILRSRPAEERHTGPGRPPMGPPQGKAHPPRLGSSPGRPASRHLPGTRGPRDPLSLHVRLCLFDADKHYVAGNYNSEDRFNYKPIVSSNKTIGWLGLKNKPESIKPLELQFLQKQNNSFYTIGAGIFILTLLISYILSKHLLSPIQELVRGTKAMRNFDFNTRINVRTTDELGDLAADFNLMVKTLKHYETLRKNWISDISHELRTPVAVIRSKVEALQDGIRVMTPSLLNSLHNDIMGLGNLVNDLHMTAMEDSETLIIRPKSINPLELADQCLSSFSVRLEKQQIKAQTDWKNPQLEIKGDAPLLTRVFNNLIENTLRYTHSPGILKISHRIKKSYLLLCFEDSSPAVPEGSIELIFDRLYRVEKSRNRALGGSGLGLSIARQIITRHGGSIDAAPSPLGGVKIKIKLPFEQ